MITVNPPQLPPATLGAPYQQQLSAIGGTAPYRFSLGFGALPPGLTLDSSGLISGAPTSAGAFTFGVLATDATGAGGGLQYTLQVGAAITISPASLPGAVSGSPYRLQLSASGGTGPYTYATGFGALPPGVVLDASGLINGTPTTAGSFTFGVLATDSAGGSGGIQYTLDVATAIAISPTSLPNAVAGVAYSQQITASGGIPPFTFSVGFGALPPGLTLDASGVLSGAPTAAGSFSFGVLATDQTGASGGQPYTLVVAVPITLSPATLPDGVSGVPYSQQLSANGGTAPFTFAIAAGALPGGVALDLGGLVSGTPTDSGTFSFDVVATDQTGATGRLSYLLQVAPRPVTIAISPATLPDATNGVPYSQQLAAGGGTGPYAFSVGAGALPPGVTLDAAGLISGTPTAFGSFSFGARATDATGAVGSQNYTLKVVPNIALSPTTLPSATAGVAYNQTLTASGGTAPYAFGLAFGTLPPGLTLTAGGVLSGTPQTSGSFLFGVIATDASGASGTQQYTLDIAPPIVITPTSLPNGAVGLSYSEQLVATGGTAPFVFSVVFGALPPGLTLDASGLVTGVPAAPGSFTFSVQATDATGASAGQTYALDVAPSIAISPTTLPAGAVRAAYSQQLSAGGGTAPYTFSVGFGALPPGITLSGAGLLSGSPTAPGTFSFGVTATDATRATGSQGYALDVAPAIVIDPPALPAGTVGVAYSQQLTASGGTAPYTLSLAAGSLPPGLTLAASGLLSGTPTSAGTFNFSVQAKDATNASGTQQYSVSIAVVVANPPTIQSFKPKKAAVGDTVTVNGANFTGTTDVSFGGGVAASFIVQTDNVLTATVPFGALTGAITVTTPGGSAQTATPLQVAPTIDSFSPTAALPGATVTLSGSGFTGVTAVQIKTLAVQFTFVNDFTVKVTIPQGAQDGKFKLSTPVGTTASGSLFDVIIPVFNNFQPKKGITGDTIALKGDDLDSASKVTFNGVDAGPLLMVTATQVLASVPVNATTGKLTVTTIVGDLVSAVDFTVLPHIDSFNPSSGPAGTPVTILGEGFLGVIKVEVHLTNAAFTIVSDTTIKATVPAGATTGKIKVYTATNKDASPTNFTVT